MSFFAGALWAMPVSVALWLLLITGGLIFFGG